jgi:hypothetical protein
MILILPVAVGTYVPRPLEGPRSPTLRACSLFSFFYLTMQIRWTNPAGRSSHAPATPPPRRRARTRTPKSPRCSTETSTRSISKSAKRTTASNAGGNTETREDSLHPPPGPTTRSVRWLTTCSHCPANPPATAMVTNRRTSSSSSSTARRRHHLPTNGANTSASASASTAGRFRTVPSGTGNDGMMSTPNNAGRGGRAGARASTFPRRSTSTTTTPNRRPRKTRGIQISPPGPTTARLRRAPSRPHEEVLQQRRSVHGVRILRWRRGRRRSVVVVVVVPPRRFHHPRDVVETRRKCSTSI